MVKVKEDLSGQIFNRLTVIEQTDDYIKPSGKREAQWLCKCDCGNFCKVTGYRLKKNHTKSCGCYRTDISYNLGIILQQKYPKQIIRNEYNLSGEYGIGYTSKGEEFYFDLEDYDKIKDYTWHIDENGYVANTKESLFMHRVIMNPDNDKYIDHIYHKKYDNRKSQLRIVTGSQNGYNRQIQSNNTSGITGVYFHKPSNKWVAYTKINNKQIRKYCNTKEEAINERINLENTYFKEYAYNNCKENKYE